MKYRRFQGGVLLEIWPIEADTPEEALRKARQEVAFDCGMRAVCFIGEDGTQVYASKAGDSYIIPPDAQHQERA